MRAISIITLLLFLAVAGKAQDLHFSHFYHSPLYLNPAKTGAFDGSLRLGGNFRNQWQSISVPYRTFGVWGDYKFWEDDGWEAAVGLTILQDQAGDGNLTVQKVFGSISLTRSLTHSLSATIGLGGGQVQKKLDFNQLIFNDQWTGIEFDNGLPSNEPVMGEQKLNFRDVTAGLRLDYKPDDEFNWSLSFAMAHINQPSETFTGSSNKIGMRPVVQTGGLLKLNDRWRVEPEAIWMLQKKAQEIVLGANVGYTLQEETPIILYGGGWYRSTGDAVPALGLQYKKVKGIISYDVNLSSLSVASRGFGGVELSLVYILEWNKPDPRIVVPCVRF